MTSCSPQRPPFDWLATAGKHRDAKTLIMHLPPHLAETLDRSGYPGLAGGGRRPNWISASVSNRKLCKGAVNAHGDH